MGPDKLLVVDVGMHRGEDAENYLAQGFCVLSIEANPALVSDVTNRLASHVKSGDLRIVHAAIVERPGDVLLHVGSESGWSSVDPRRAGAPSDTQHVVVPGRTLADVLEGEVAHYVKIDIEGEDAAAVRSALTLSHLPDYLSWECDLTDLTELAALVGEVKACGYARFKLVNQARNDDGNLSGPFGDAAPGPWMDAQQLLDRLRVVAHQQRLRTRIAEGDRLAGISLSRLRPLLRRVYGAPAVKALRSSWSHVRGTEMGGWFDIHAARPHEAAQDTASP